MITTPFLLITYVFILFRADAGALPKVSTLDQLFERVELDDFAFQTGELFNSFARSRSDCARICMSVSRLGVCLSFTFRATSGGGGRENCRGSDFWVTADIGISYFNISYFNVGARTYRRRLEEGMMDGVSTMGTTVKTTVNARTPIPSSVQDTLFILPLSTTWLEKDCIYDNDCPNGATQCFMQKCVCTPGFYYSLTRDICLADCIVFDPSGHFLAYPDSFLQGNAVLSGAPVTLKNVEDCLKHCASTLGCVSIDFDHRQRISQCRLSPNTALTAPDTWTVQPGVGTYHYQRYCM